MRKGAIMIGNDLTNVRHGFTRKGTKVRVVLWAPSMSHFTGDVLSGAWAGKQNIAPLYKDCFIRI